MRQILAVLMTAAVLLAAAACGGKAASTTSSSTSPTPTPIPGSGSGFGSSYPFEVVITSKYEQEGTTGQVVTEADCQVPAGTAAGTTLACTNTAGTSNSTVAIPEGRLFFSKLSFTLAVGSEGATKGCEIVVFQPYYYIASSSAGFSPPWVLSGSTVDCSVPSKPADCYGGIARDIVTNFPANRAVYYSTAGGIYTNTWTSANSANSRTYGSNRYTVNNLVTRNAPAHNWQDGDAYVGTSNKNYVDYVFACLDKYYDNVYTFTMKLTDIDTNGVYPNTSQGTPSINFFPDWDLLSWDY